MNLNRQKLTPYFFIALFSCLLFPTWRLTFFAPFLIMLFYKKSLPYCLWTAMAVGILLDLLSSQSRFGFFAVSYCLATWMLYSQKRYFFADRLSTLPLMTFLFVELVTIIQLLLISASFDKYTIISWKWFATDLFIMPLFDVAYASVFFLLPIVLMTKMKTTKRTKMAND